MTKKIFITTIFLLVSYCLLLNLKKVESLCKPQNIWQENMVRLQDYVYGSINSERVIIGSSLSMRITILNDNYYSLAAGGGNPFIGLEILKYKSGNVKKVLIETNYLLTKSPSDDKYTGELFKPIVYNLRAYFPVLLVKNQPFSVLGTFLMHRMILSKILESNGKVRNGLDRTKEKRIAAFKKDYSDSILVKNLVEMNISRLKVYYRFFKMKGIDLIFYEMPVDCSLENDPLPVYCRRMVDNFCKTYNIKQIKLDSCNKYETSDGNHLTDESGIRYSHFFYSEIENK